jgi:hypothetical protein
MFLPSSRLVIPSSSKMTCGGHNAAGEDPTLYFIPTCSRISDDSVLGSITKLIDFFYIVITNTKMQKKRRPYLVLFPTSPQHCTMSRGQDHWITEIQSPKSNGRCEVTLRRTTTMLFFMSDFMLFKNSSSWSSDKSSSFSFCIFTPKDLSWS